MAMLNLTIVPMINIKKKDWGIFLAPPLIVACLEVLWNTPLARLPIYWLPVYTPSIAIILNTILHLIVTVAPIFVLGWLLMRIFKNTRVLSFLFLIAGLVYTAYMSSIFLRLLWEIRDDPVFYPALKTITVGWILIVCLVFGAIVALKLRSRALENRIVWPATLGISTVIGVTAIVLRWPLAKLWGLAAVGLMIIIFHFVLWLLNKSWCPSTLKLAGGLLVITIVVTFGRCIWASIGNAGEKPNIVITLWDAARADRMSLYGYESKTTPVADKLAENGVVFQRAHSTANYTFPSHVSIFTGLYNREHELWDNPEGYDNYSTLAQELKSFGYRTILISENPWVLPLHNGFDLYYGPFTRRMSVQWAKDPHKARPFPPFPIALTIPSPFIARQVIDHLRHENQGWYKFVIDDYELRAVAEQLVLGNQPLFVFFNWMNVHNRYFPDRVYQTDKIVDPYPVQEEYEEALKYADFRLGKLVKLFHDASALQKTVFVVTSDHGQLHGEHKLWGHGRTLFEPVLHIPLLISWKEWSEREDVLFPATQVSLKQALVQLVKNGRALRNTPQELVSAFENNKGVVSEIRLEEHNEDGSFQRGLCYLAPDGKKFIYDPELKNWENTGNKQMFLFDLDNDQSETRNIFEIKTELGKSLLNKYHKWEESLSLPVVADSENKYPVGLKKQLEAMGYLQ